MIRVCARRKCLQQDRVSEAWSCHRHPIPTSSHPFLEFREPCFQNIAASTNRQAHSPLMRFPSAVPQACLPLSFHSHTAPSFIFPPLFPAFRHVQHDLQKPNLTMKERDHGAVFMRWKERFLVPDHRVQDINGASFAGKMTSSPTVLLLTACSRLLLCLR